MTKLIQFLAGFLQKRISRMMNILNAIEAALFAIINRVFGFLTPLKSVFKSACRLLLKSLRILGTFVVVLIPVAFIVLAVGKFYQHLDDDEDRGAIAVKAGAFGESFSTPVYVDQGWDRSDSLWFYNTTQGSNLMPYDLFVELEQADSEKLFRANDNIDRFRYLAQKPTLFNPDGLPVGFVQDNYKGKEYVGYTCAACHTGQVNYNGKAIRIDGGPAMADMDGFLYALEQSMRATLTDSAKKARFIKNVLERNDLDNSREWWRAISQGVDYTTEKQVLEDLATWTNRINLYNLLNQSSVHYGYARLDAFGRIYNRVLQHVLNKEQVANRMAFAFYDNGQRVITDVQIDNVLLGLDNIILGQSGFEEIIKRLQSKAPGYPGLGDEGISSIREILFNEADAPVSYPFLWDIAQSDYVQWNGLAANAGIGPLGRNTGEVIGVFGTLDWKEDEGESWRNNLSFSAYISGQSNKRKHIDFDSSINKTNLGRLESHLKTLQSPVWDEVEFADGSGLPEIDPKLAKRGRQIYANYCESCHEVIDRSAWDRKVIGKMMSLDKIGTDPKMAENGVNYTGPSGNFKHVYQDTDAGSVIIEDEAPVVQILTAATRGVIATPDSDKWAIRRLADWFYTLASSLFDNSIKVSVKSGDYQPDTTANPYASLKAYKARSLNGIWATAPYLHNGSVPTLYDLFLPKKRKDDSAKGEYRPDIFYVGCRELDVSKVGVACDDGKGFAFDTSKGSNSNAGHEYAAGRTAQLGESKPLPALNVADRWALVEYLKTL